jgi:AcrR family transcriptional regulator
MPSVKSRREIYADATRAAILEAATELFAERGYRAASLEDVAAQANVTRGAVYHHFNGKQALFEEVVETVEEEAMQQVLAAANASDPWDAGLQAVAAYLDKCCEPKYGRLVWIEGPAALGWQKWRECEEKYAYDVTQRFVSRVVEAGYFSAESSLRTTSQFAFWMLGGAGLRLAETPEEDKPRLRDEWAALMFTTLSALRVD